MLNVQNLESFQNMIPVTELPANFRDAIEVTRQLGIRYLWIDSLCIMQDSRPDWETESKRMGAYYQNAHVTVCAAASHRSTEGFLRSSKLPRQSRKQASLKLRPDSKPDDVVKFSFADEDEEDLLKLFLHGPLCSRGWTLQEFLLSPRILHYGREQIYWQCKHGFQAANGVPPGRKYPESEVYHEISAVISAHVSGQHLSQTPHADIVFQEYYGLVQDYSLRSLTYGGDKFPALSGLVGLLHPFLGGEYLAGLWSKDIKRGLLWFKEGLTSLHAQVYQAPSWSW